MQLLYLMVIDANVLNLAVFAGSGDGLSAEIMEVLVPLSSLLAVSPSAARILTCTRSVVAAPF